ncbi:MAG: tRNA pseudouridine(55) synthase TruB, partial [Patescibacteria group bacterium]
GHAGTLDPFATGLLLVAVGREATREISEYVGLDKVYEAEFVLGATTDSLDTETEIVIDPSGPVKNLSLHDIEQAINKLTGEQNQIPPMHSAIKKGGQKLYKLARQGKSIEREPRTIIVHEFKLLSNPEYQDDLMIVQVTIKCSSGTYIRALARDLGRELGTTGYVRSLRRTSIGNFAIENAVMLNSLTSENWRQYSIKL